MIDSTESAPPPDQPSRPKTGAERTRAWRARLPQRENASAVPPNVRAEIRSSAVKPAVASAVTASVTPAVTPNGTRDVTANGTPDVTANVAPDVTASHSRVTLWWSIKSYLLTAAAFVLGGAGTTISGSFGQSLGSSDVAGGLYLAVGVAADLIVFAVPSKSVQLWRARQRAVASASWIVWLVAFVYVVLAGIGFASDNLANVKLERASIARNVTRAEEALRDAEASRERECRSGAGRFCREREQDERDRRRERNAAVSSAENSADPQTEAAIKIVAWITAGKLKPTADDFSMLRLILLALFPPVGGLLLMITSSRQEE
ncbi:hypothetical protein [Bradyrhizobium sp. AS23.2]|uniref:hypothetical protein n=1 Tax=Bradyrhizobium sp. AS23.2 TaxID=1680155 RepID=UPI00093A7184|nr:hypothetical protein [Bradyrhizobium sp. AS23.2]OKO79813.1 hypothetical protein AC630_16740 [Bradyrhizobium sp. AS23.2]